MEADAERPRVVMVTGASTFVGGYLVARLAQNPTIERILAIDSRTPTKDMLRRMGRAEFVRADIRHSAISRLIDSREVDTVLHAGTSVMDSTPHSAAIKELTVMGAVQLCAACQRSPSVKRLIVRSSGTVYGSSPRNPAHLSENTRVYREPSSGYGRDLLDIESYARSLGRRRPDINVTILRLAPILGPRIHTRLSRFLASPLVPAAVGYEARLQFLHEEDALGAIEHAILASVPGTYNVAGDGAVTLTQAVRRLGRVTVRVPSPLVDSTVELLGRLKVARISAGEGGFVTHGRVLDTTRMRTELGFAPLYSSIETLDDFLSRGGIEPVIRSQVWQSMENRMKRIAQSIA